MKTAIKALFAFAISVPTFGIAGPVLFSGNGHYYDFIPGSLTWDAARSDAASRTYLGVQGHLVTFTNAAEDAFVRTTFASQVSQFVGPWCGGTRSGSGSGPTAGWSWVTGEPFTYTGWNVGEPSGGVENTLHFSGGGWNDIANDRTDAIGYLIEYVPCSVGPLTIEHIPEPPYNDSCLVQELREKIACFASAVATAGGTIKSNAACRTARYQDHLFEIFYNYNNLAKLPGISARWSRGPLDTTPATAGCQTIVDRINEEIGWHFANTVPEKVASGFLFKDLAPISKHVRGRAVDWSVELPFPDEVDVLAAGCGLWRPLLPKSPDKTGEPWHFELMSDGPRRKLAFTSHSPINLLVQDPNGQSIGFDPSTGNVNAFGTNAWYSGAGSTPQIIEILPDAVVTGNYQVSGIGIGTGAYVIDLKILSDDDTGDVWEKTLASGVVQNGQPLPSIAPIDCVRSTMWLQYTHVGQNMRLMTPPWATNVVIEWTSNLTMPGWSELGQPIGVPGGILLTNVLEGTRFFRLRSQ